MDSYEQKAVRELRIWQNQMLKAPSFTSSMAKVLQSGINSIIPERAHKIITGSVKNMVKAVLLGSQLSTKPPVLRASLAEREQRAKERIDFYKKAAATSGAWTGSGGIFLGLADFPILMSLKLKFLFDIASIYGFDVGNYKERLYILYIFQLAFSSKEKSREIYLQILHWNSYAEKLPEDLDSFDWRTFQQQYRDYIDLAKMLQLVPVIGAAVGAYANYKLMDKLGETAMNAYRLRRLPH